MDTVLRGAIIYLVLFALTRLAGRRSLSEATSFDLVLLIVLSETVQQALLKDDGSLTSSMLLLITLVGLDFAFAWAKSRWTRAEDILDGRPTVLVAEGRPLWPELRRARVTLADVMSAARQAHGLKRFDQIEAAVLEVDGAISVIPRAN